MPEVVGVRLGLFQVQGVNAVMVMQVRNMILTQAPLGGNPEDERVAQATQKLFGELQFSPLCAAGVGSLAEALRLQTDIQQDPQEFMKLFQSLLEKAYEMGDETGQGMFQRQFAGGTSYVTMCKQCKEFSKSSFDVHNFLDLQLQVGQHQTLEESLEAYMSPCLLTGSNKYSCEVCKMPTDAERRVLLRKLPPRLQITLSRFDYDFENGVKKKICTAVKLPVNLDLTSCLQRTADILSTEAIAGVQSAKYTLTCIIHHLGTRADFGHYVAQVCLPTGDWWIIDDDVASLVGRFPEGSPNQHRKKPTKDKEDRKNGMLTSNSAYICIYTQDNEWASQSMAAEQSECEALSKVRNCVEERINQTLEETNIAWNVVMKGVEERKAFARDVMSCINVNSGSDDDCWISSDWLASCMDDENEPSCIDNSNITCVHGKLDPCRISAGKRISLRAFQKICSRYGASPKLSTKALCKECLLPICEKYLSANKEAATRSSILEILKEPLSGEGHEYWISRSWLQGWKKRGGQAAFLSDPTSAIVCRHNRLAPQGMATRVKVSSKVWEFFRDSYYQHQLHPSGSAGDSDTATPCKVDQPMHRNNLLSLPVVCSKCCDECSIEVDQQANELQAARDLARRISSSLPRLSSGSHLDIEPEVIYYLWPKSWFSTWRKWLEGKGKDPTEKPLPLPEIGKQLLCSCHPEKPGTRNVSPKVQRDRGKITVDAASNEVWEIMTEDEWQVLCFHHSNDDSDAVSPIKCFIQLSELLPPEKKVRTGNGSSWSQDIKLCMEPAPCECLTDISVKPSVPFTDELFEVVLVSGEAAARAASSNRASRRRLGRQKVQLSSTDTVHILKIKIYELLSVALPNQRVFWDSMEIMGDIQTLGDLGLQLGTVINVINAKVIDDNDTRWLDDELAAQLRDKRKCHDKETGFANTVLLGGF